MISVTHVAQDANRRNQKCVIIPPNYPGNPPTTSILHVLPHWLVRKGVSVVYYQAAAYLGLEGFHRLCVVKWAHSQCGRPCAP